MPRSMPGSRRTLGSVDPRRIGMVERTGFVGALPQDTGCRHQWHGLDGPGQVCLRGQRLKKESRAARTIPGHGQARSPSRSRGRLAGRPWPQALRILASPRHPRRQYYAACAAPGRGRRARRCPQTRPALGRGGVSGAGRGACGTASEEAPCRACTPCMWAGS